MIGYKFDYKELLCQSPKSNGSLIICHYRRQGIIKAMFLEESTSAQNFTLFYVRIKGPSINDVTVLRGGRGVKNYQKLPDVIYGRPLNEQNVYSTDTCDTLTGGQQCVTKTLFVFLTMLLSIV